MKPRIGIISDCGRWRLAARQALFEGDALLAGEAADATESIELCAEYMPDLLLINIGNQQEKEKIIQEVRADYPTVIILTMEPLAFNNVVSDLKAAEFNDERTIKMVMRIFLMANF